MEKKWSKNWNSSVQPRKQRKFRINAPIGVKKKFLSAHLAANLREKYTTRSIVLRKGDQIRIQRGSHKGVAGIVERVDTNKGRVYIESLKTKKADGSEIMKPVVASNVIVTSVALDDKKRVQILRRKGAKDIKVEPKKEIPKETKKETPKDKSTVKETKKEKK